MPAGSVSGAVAADTFPSTLSTKFTEIDSIEVNANEYHDGTLQNKALAVSSRKSWKLSKRLTPALMVQLRDFTKRNAANAFYFYSPFETDPPFNQNPAGESGRYLVRLASDWDQQTSFPRSDASVELIEVASPDDIASASSITNGNVPISAVLSLVSAHTPNAGFTPNFGAGASLSPVGLIFPVPDWFHSTAAWTKRTDSELIDPASVLGGAGGLSLLLMLEQDGSGGSGVLSPPDTFDIYDCYVIVAYGDGTTQTFRPTSSASIVTGASGAVTNGPAAYDGDPNTFATISVSQYASFFNGSFLNLNTFRLIA